jgi:hypothetical protein
LKGPTPQRAGGILVSGLPVTLAEVDFVLVFDGDVGMESLEKKRSDGRCGGFLCLQCIEQSGVRLED